MRKLVFGCGYLGHRVARRWLAAGHAVSVFTRGREKADRLRAEGFDPIVGEILDPATLAHLPPAETVLFAVGYDRGNQATAAIETVYAEGVRNVAAAVDRSLLKKFIYISSTGVYGAQAGGSDVGGRDVGGVDVDESSPCRPDREGGKACVAAENAITVSPVAGQAVILRLAGIYGPGRIPRAADLKQGTPLAVDPDSWLNLIHVDDAAAIVLRADAAARPPFLCVVSDGVPVRRGDYYRELARLLGAPAPNFATPEGATSRGRVGGDKRICAHRLFRELSPVLQFPDYRTGLEAIVTG